jgi:hypothetical protein
MQGVTEQARYIYKSREPVLSESERMDISFNMMRTIWLLREL